MAKQCEEYEPKQGTIHALALTADIVAMEQYLEQDPKSINMPGILPNHEYCSCFDLFSQMKLAIQHCIGQLDVSGETLLWSNICWNMMLTYLQRYDFNVVMVC